MHRPEGMLCECNLLSRYNLHVDRLCAAEAKTIMARDQRIEAKLAAGTSPNKGTKKLAEDKVITALSLLIPHEQLGDSVFAHMMRDFQSTLVF